MKLIFRLSLIVVPAMLLAACKHVPFVTKTTTLPYDHVIVVMEENHGFDDLIGSANAPYINQLASGGALFTDSHGVTHPSQANYLALFSGDTQGVVDDKCLENETPYTTPNLGAALLAKKLTFTGYAQTMPSAGFMECAYATSTLTNVYLYARKHTPWVNWVGTDTNNIPATDSQPMTAFPTDFTKLPTVAFVVPDMDYDMHNIGALGDAAAIQRGDNWLKTNIAAYAEWAKTHNSLLILTYDEDDYKVGKRNQIPTIFYGANVIPGKYNETINHYSVLHTLEHFYELPVTDTVTAPPITSIFKK